jgi:hypothetical protein
VEAPPVRVDDDPLHNWRLIVQVACRCDPAIKFGVKMSEIMKIFCLGTSASRRQTTNPEFSQKIAIVPGQTINARLPVVSMLPRWPEKKQERG